MNYFQLHLDDSELNVISNLALAHIGDGVYELMVRSWLCVHGKATNRGLHKATIQYVSATAQAKAAEKLLLMMTQEEKDVFRRGRNSTPHSVSKAANREEYQLATAVEAVFGYLWLKGNIERLNELFENIMEESSWP